MVMVTTQQTAAIEMGTDMKPVKKGPGVNSLRPTVSRHSTEEKNAHAGRGQAAAVRVLPGSIGEHALGAP